MKPSIEKAQPAQISLLKPGTLLLWKRLDGRSCNCCLYMITSVDTIRSSYRLFTLYNGAGDLPRWGSTHTILMGYIDSLSIAVLT